MSLFISYDIAESVLIDYEFSHDMDIFKFIFYYSNHHGLDMLDKFTVLYFNIFTIMKKVKMIEVKRHKSKKKITELDISKIFALPTR